MTKKQEVKFEYWENGNKKSEEHYKDGKLDGVSTGWFEDGQLKVYADFKNDVMHGDWVGYYENGERICSKTFEHGKEVFTTPTNCRTSYLKVEEGSLLSQFKEMAEGRSK